MLHSLFVVIVDEFLYAERAILKFVYILYGEG